MSAVVEPQAVALNNGDPYAKTYRYEAELLKRPQVDMPVEHAFCAGLYARTMRLFAGHGYTGAVHNGESFFVVRSGFMASYEGDADPVFLKTGDMHVVKHGSKRAVVAVTDCIVTTFHANPADETDPVALWDLYTLPAPPAAIEQSKTEALS